MKQELQALGSQAGAWEPAEPATQHATPILLGFAPLIPAAVSSHPMKPIRLTRHAVEQCLERGATATEVCYAVEQGSREPAKHGRMLCRCNFPHNGLWQGNHYAIKQVAPVIKEERDEIVVISVYTFFF